MYIYIYIYHLQQFMIITLIEMLHMARIFPWETFSNTSQKEIRFLFDQECFWSVCSHNVCSLFHIMPLKPC